MRKSSDTSNDLVMSWVFNSKKGAGQNTSANWHPLQYVSTHFYCDDEALKHFLFWVEPKMEILLCLIFINEYGAREPELPQDHFAYYTYFSLFQDLDFVSGSSKVPPKEKGTFTSKYRHNNKELRNELFRYSILHVCQSRSLAVFSFLPERLLIPCTSSSRDLLWLSSTVS